jgi:hypothetical protein
MQVSDFTGALDAAEILCQNVNFRYLFSKAFLRSPKGMMRLPVAKTTSGVFSELVAFMLEQPAFKLVREKVKTRNLEGIRFIEAGYLSL